MSRIKIKDNSRIPKASLSGISFLTSKIADKTLEQLENEGIFVFPEILRDADDITKDQMILQSVNNYYLSSNVMGFMGLGDEKLIVESRFSGNGQDFLFQYLLERVFDVPNIVDLETDANNDDQCFRPGGHLRTAWDYHSSNGNPCGILHSDSLFYHFRGMAAPCKYQTSCKWHRE